ncbi:unnamed protein product [Bemisia tabaci]|uniref:Thioredoxin domain-containing protein n=1 Tax=Bemisia tabaci TaxID=7038 RepID=A0A9P0A1M0_BEMTA|nr:unnamed protein product [Bemisia tabaci]
MRIHSAIILPFVYFFSAPSFEATHETGAVEPADGAKNKEYPKSLEEESLSNVASVSKFIKEFHKKFEDELVPDLDSSKDDLNDEYSPKAQPKISSSTSNLTNSTWNVNCIVSPDSPSSSVELINSTRLHNLLAVDANVTSRTAPAECIVILFYAKTCPFSAMAGPHFNALPRAFPTIKIAALNALKHQSHNTQFGILSIPTLLLFHNGRPVAKFNESEFTLDSFAKFIHRMTGILPKEKMFVSSADFGGPVPSMPDKEVDHFLIAAWIIIIIAAGLGFQKSRWWQTLVEACKNSWREAEIQHEHNE